MTHATRIEMSFRMTAGVLLAAGTLALPAAPLFAQSPRTDYTSVAVEYSHSQFTGDTDPWHLGSVELLRRGSAGSIAGRATVARRFGRIGEQFELEAYPLLGSRAYAYLNAGYSPSGIFPTGRFGAEIFGTVAPGLELSGGMRHLAFEVADVTLLTASAGYYTGPFYLSVRPFLSSMDGERNASVNLMGRRFLSDVGDYVGVVAGAGAVPREEATAFDLQRLHSAHVALDGRHWTSTERGVRWSAGYEWEEVSTERTRGRVTLSLGLEARL